MEQKKQINSQDQTYIIFNKKIGQTCSKNSSEDKNSIFDSLKEENIQELSYIHELDTQASGLIILSDDLEFINKVKKTNSTIKKEYIATLTTELTRIHKKQLERGIIFDEKKVPACSIKQLGIKYLIKINENTENQLKKMFESLGYEIQTLHRIKIGKVNLQKSGLKPGKYKKIPKELLEKKIFVN